MAVRARLGSLRATCLGWSSRHEEPPHSTAAEQGAAFGGSLITPRRFWIRTHGCQMNVHDSEKVANLLLHHGWELARGMEDAGLLILNTCSIRDKAEHRLYSELGKLREWKQSARGRSVGVAGCVAQQQGDALLRRFSHLDFVYGTHNLRRAPQLAAAALPRLRASHAEEKRPQDRFALPSPHPSPVGDHVLRRSSWRGTV